MTNRESTTTIPDLSAILACLPQEQRERVSAQVAVYVQALDQAIEAVLKPTIGRSESGFVISDSIIPLYGVGTTPKEAMEDYRSAVVEYYESLLADRAELGETLVRQLDVLQRVFDLANNGL